MDMADLPSLQVYLHFVHFTSCRSSPDDDLCFATCVTQTKLSKVLTCQGVSLTKGSTWPMNSCLLGNCQLTTLLKGADGVCEGGNACSKHEIEG